MNTPKRIQVFERDNYTCWMCKIKVVEGNNAGVDHYIPVSKGGANTLKNLRTACKVCNANRKNQLPQDLSEFGEYNPNFTKQFIPKYLRTSHQKDELTCKICGKEVTLRMKAFRNGKELGRIAKFPAKQGERKYFVLCQNCSDVKKKESLIKKGK